MPLTMIRNLSGTIYKGMTKSKSQISPKYAQVVNLTSMTVQVEKVFLGEIILSIFYTIQENFMTNISLLGLKFHV